MILAMVDEPLVLVVKLADRLHNMRTVYALRPDRRRAVAAETMQVWCSLAERLGLFSLKVRRLHHAMSAEVNYLKNLWRCSSTLALHHQASVYETGPGFVWKSSQWRLASNLP